MKGVNRVLLLGYIGKSPELLTSKGGKYYAKLSLATHRPRTLENGEKEDHTDWHRVTVWGKKAELCVHHLTRGSALMVEGHIENYKTEREGQTQNHTTIVAEDVHFIPNPRQREMPAAVELT